MGKVRNALNLLLTFLVSGLWHGAAWHFVVWGGFHGLLQTIENCFPFMRRLSRRAKEEPGNMRGVKVWLLRIMTFVIVMLAWVFFRAEHMSDAWYVLAHMLEGIRSPALYITEGLMVFGMRISEVLFVVIPLAILMTYDYVSLRKDPILLIRKCKKPVRWLVYYGFVFLVLMLASFNAQEFVYFQF